MTSSITLRQGLVAIVSLLILASGAVAQDNPELGDIDSEGEGDMGAGGEAGGSVGGGGSATWSAPQASGGGQGYATPATGGSSSDSEVDDVPAGDTDHSRYIGSFGVGWFGILELPTCNTGCGPMGTAPDTVPAHTIGARYWLDEMLGIEAALGFYMSSGETSVTTTVGMPPMSTKVTTEDPSLTGFALHAGVPLVLKDTKHVAFEVVPQLNFGIVSGSQKAPSGSMLPDTDMGGMLFGIGATVGTEIHFGFIDLPSLALQANVGLNLNFESRNAEVTNQYKTESSGLVLRTFQGSNPWEIMAGRLSAIYYL